MIIATSTCNPLFLTSSADYPELDQTLLKQFTDVNSGINPLYFNANTGERFDLSTYLTSGLNTYPYKIECDYTLTQEGSLLLLPFLIIIFILINQLILNIFNFRNFWTIKH